ncbi:MAG TPA: FIST N-terminal domain-containing protein [Kofleriaceae bacterium]|nr:FIST N-terminal domain-containing protein [Kofleriaceae bacterium]
MAEPIARQAFVAGRAPGQLARALADRLAGPDLRIAFMFADRRLDPAGLAGVHRELGVPVVGCSAAGVIGPGPLESGPGVVGLGLYGDWVRAGIGVATDLSGAALTHSHDAVHRAAAALGTSADALEPGRHVAITMIDGRYDREEAFCIGSAAAAPRIRFVGGCTSTDLDHGEGSAAPPAMPAAMPTSVWVNGEVLTDAGVIIVLESDQPFHAVTSAHLVPTELRTVVTAVSGRVIEQLDGRPAAPRLRQLIASIGDQLDEPRPSHAFARYINGVPYVRSLHEVAGDHLVLTCAVEPGHVLRVMQPGDLLGATRRDLATATTRLGGSIAAFLAFSSTGRHDEAAARGTEGELAAAYAACHAVGFHTPSEQSGMLLVNHTLTGLAIGAPKS